MCPPMCPQGINPMKGMWCATFGDFATVAEMFKSCVQCGLCARVCSMGIRPHHLTPDRTAADSVKISGTVLVAEISGSESVIHVNVDDNNWVSESHGVRPYKVGDSADFFMKVGRCLYFGGDGSFLAG